MAHFRNKINLLASSRAIFAAILPHSFSRMLQYISWFKFNRNVTKAPACSGTNLVGK